MKTRTKLGANVMDMTNNDILVRLRYALDLKNTEMVEIFKLGGYEVSLDEVLKMLVKSKDNEDLPHSEDEEYYIKCNPFMLESFLNGLIIFKRGKQEAKPSQDEKPVMTLMDNRNANNVMLKKVKIALALTSEDMLDIFQKAGIRVTKGELGALLRKEGHKNYMECGDKFARNFLKGLAIKYRG
jgi:uncharacterized protein YehS (DUF1456 family)